jgi:putative membrane protein
MKAKEWFKDFGKGAVLGTGILPGVSVGTVGIIVGIYDKLLSAINDLRHHFGKAFLRLLPIALGCIIAAVILLIGQKFLYDSMQFEITALFAGFILGGLPVILFELRERKFSLADIARVAAGFVVAAGIGIMSVVADKYFGIDLLSAFLDPNANWWVYPVTFVVGFVAAVACILPGISGSMVLFIFGLYNPVVDLFIGNQSMFANHDRIGTGLLLTFILLVGVIAGLFTISKLMVGLMKKHHRGTFTVVMGFVLGSIIAMFVNNQIWNSYSKFQWWDYLIGAVLFLAAVIVLTILIVRNHKKILVESTAETSIKTSEKK